MVFDFIKLIKHSKKKVKLGSTLAFFLMSCLNMIFHGNNKENIPYEL